MSTTAPDVDIVAEERTPSSSNPSSNSTSPKTNTSHSSSNYVTLHALTWNVSGNIPALHDIQSLFLPKEGLGMRRITEEADVLAIGLQEAYPKLQEAMTSSLPVIGRDPLVDNFSVVLSKSGYARVSYCRIVGILVMVFVKRALLCYISGVSTSPYRTGAGGLWGNKGATSVRFILGNISMVFTNCHLMPHPENNERRVEELGNIFDYTSFPSSHLSILQHDVVILLGDLNFRLGNKEFDNVVQSLYQNKQRELINNLDQLMKEQIRGSRSPSHLHLFLEMQIDFDPSYKYEPGTDTYHDGGKGRAPAWTDRVLWYIHQNKLPQPHDVNPQRIVEPAYYCLHNQPRISDHKAVSCSLQLLTNITKIEPRVVFRLSEWICGIQGRLEFDIARGTNISSWDWIGLYNDDFVSVEKDALFWMYTPAVSGAATHMTYYSKPLPAEKVPSVPGRYILVYWSSYYRCVLGMSPAFKMSLQESKGGVSPAGNETGVTDVPSSS